MGTQDYPPAKWSWRWDSASAMQLEVWANRELPYLDRYLDCQGISGTQGWLECPTGHIPAMKCKTQEPEKEHLQQKLHTYLCRGECENPLRPRFSCPPELLEFLLRHPKSPTLIWAVWSWDSPNGREVVLWGHKPQWSELTAEGWAGRKPEGMLLAG